MINTILKVLGIKKDRRTNKMDYEDICNVLLRIEALEEKMERHTHCDGSFCDPWPEITKEEEKAGSTWDPANDFSKLRIQKQNELKFDWDASSPDFMEWLDNIDNLIEEQLDKEKEQSKVPKTLKNNGIKKKVIKKKK